MPNEWEKNTASWEIDKVQNNPAISDDVEMSLGQNPANSFDARGSLFEPNAQMGMVVNGVLVMPDKIQSTTPAVNRNPWGNYLNEQQVDAHREEEGVSQWAPFASSYPHVQTSCQPNMQPEVDWAARLRGPTVSFQQQSLFGAHPNSLRPEDQRPNFFHLRNSRLLAQPGRHRHIVPPDPAAVIRRNIRQREMEEQERRKYIARDKRARKTVNPRPLPRPQVVPVPTDDVEMPDEERTVSHPAQQLKRFVAESPKVIEVVALGSRGGQTEQRAADLRKVEKSFDVVKKTPKKKTPTPAPEPDLEDEQFGKDTQMHLHPSLSSTFNEGFLEPVTQSFEKLAVRKYTYPNTNSGRLDATAWKSINGEYGAIMQRCFCSVPSEDITKRETIVQLEAAEQELIKEKKISATCCAPYRSSPGGTKICNRTLDKSEQERVRYLPQTAVLGFFCGKHSALLSHHKVCPYCNEFYEAGNKIFLVCRAVKGEEHLYHLKCRSRMTMLKQCPHCLHDKSNSIEECYTGITKSVPRLMVKFSAQKDKYLFPKQDFITVELPDIPTGNSSFRFSGYVPKYQLEVIRSKAGSPDNDRTKLLRNLLDVIQNQKGNQNVFQQILVESPVYLHNCAESGDVLSLVLLHMIGCDVNVADTSGRTPLMVASIERQYAVVQALIALGADLDLQDVEGRTVLHWAARQKDAYLMRYLVVNGADITILDNKGFVATFWTLSWISYTELLSLVVLGIDLRCLDKEHWSLLHWVVFLFRNELAVFFLDLGIASLPDIWGDTPMHTAARVGNFEFVQLLLMRNPPLVITVENHQGESPLQLAQTLLERDPDPEDTVLLEKIVGLMKHFVKSDSEDSAVKDGWVLGEVLGDITGGRNYFPVPCFNYVNHERYGKDPLTYSNVVVRSLLYQNQPTPVDTSLVKKPCKLNLQGRPGNCVSPALCSSPDCGFRFPPKKAVRVQPEIVNGYLLPSMELEAFQKGLPAAVPYDGKRPPTSVELARLLRRLAEQAALRPDLRTDLCHIIRLIKMEFISIDQDRLPTFRRRRRKQADTPLTLACADAPLPAVKLPDVIQKKTGGYRLRSSSVGDFRPSNNEKWAVPASWKKIPKQDGKGGERQYNINPGYRMDLFRELEKADCEVLVKDAMVRFERTHPLERWDMSYYTRKASRKHPPWRADLRLDHRTVWSAAPRLCSTPTQCVECEGGQQNPEEKVETFTVSEKGRTETSSYDRNLEGCSVLCDCDETCPQRATQWPSIARLALFYVNDMVQWGVMALSRIMPGQFLAEYTGELVGGNLYSNDTYMYELVSLRPGERNNAWVVDAKSVGNIARFFNHCCNPSAKTIEVSEHGVVVPRLCVFAIAEVHPGQQITLDYGDNWWKAKWDNSGIKCHCEAENCKYSTAEKLNRIKGQQNTEDGARDHQYDEEEEEEEEEADSSDPDYA